MKPNLYLQNRLGKREFFLTLITLIWVKEYTCQFVDKFFFCIMHLSG